MLITIGVTLLFVILGGMRATVYTDLADALLMAGCFVAAVPFVLTHLGADRIGHVLRARAARSRGSPSRSRGRTLRRSPTGPCIWPRRTARPRRRRR
ncbi:MAG: hypothetical protein GEV11_18035 [Streptosporangiales bacterium]|nr:hypothetical protein [Streptosporangiales bacterium]